LALAPALGIPGETTLALEEVASQDGAVCDLALAVAIESPQVAPLAGQEATSSGIERWPDSPWDPQADAYGGYGGPANTPPTTSGIADVYVDEDAADVVLNLGSAFDDAEDSDASLAYEIVGNTNASLVSAQAGQCYGGLCLDFTPNASGDATITVQATDRGGLSVQTSFTVHVAPVNDPPVLLNFVGCMNGGNFWTFQGTVRDVDDAMQGRTITFGGILEGYGVSTTVQANGDFFLRQEFANLPAGIATAQTTDPHGLASNVATYAVI
jgi:hypothetical protein